MDSADRVEPGDLTAAQPGRLAAPGDTDGGGRRAGGGWRRSARLDAERGAAVACDARDSDTQSEAARLAAAGAKRGLPVRGDCAHARHSARHREVADFRSAPEGKGDTGGPGVCRCEMSGLIRLMR